MKLCINRAWIIFSWVCILNGICFILIDVCDYLFLRRWSYAGTVLGLVFVIFGLITLIANNRNFIYMNRKQIVYFSNNKPVKKLECAKIKRVLVLQIFFHKIQDAFIVLDDGTFEFKKYKKREFYKKKTILQESWIIIDYSDKRFDKVMQFMPDCPIEYIKPNQY